MSNKHPYLSVEDVFCYKSKKYQKIKHTFFFQHESKNKTNKTKPQTKPIKWIYFIRSRVTDAI